MSSVMVMLAEEYTQSGSTGSVISLLLAFVVFIGIVAWVFIIPKSRWQRDARIPLDGDSSTNGTGGNKEVNHG